MLSKATRVVMFWAIVFFVFVITPILGVSLYIYMIMDTLPPIEEISQFKYSEPMKIYDRNGDIIAELGQERRYPVPYASLPSFLGKAVVAVEDSRFYLHNGVDLVGITRAFVANVKAGRIVQGGSTLTQQLVKILYLNPEKKLKRKLKEAILAYKLDSYLSKEKILELYLNQVNFGRGGYGVKAAAINYFGKEVADLTLAEAAMIAGIPKAPGLYSPHINLERAIGRRNTVLSRMLTMNYISQENYDEAIAEEVVLVETIPLKLKYAGYFVDFVKEFIENDLKIENPEEQGLKIYTTLDISHQLAAEVAIRKNVLLVSKNEGYQGVLHREEKDNSSAQNTASDNKSIDNNSTENISTVDSKDVKKDFYTTFKVPNYLEDLGILKAKVITVTEDYVEIEVNNEKGILLIRDNRWAKAIESGRYQLTNFNSIMKDNDIIYVSKKKGDAKTKNKVSIYLLEQDPEIESALLSIDPLTGEIYAMVGGFDYNKSFFNRSVQAKRQTGSVFKPIVYAAALESGILPMDIILDAPVISDADEEGNVWKPKNFEDKFYGPTTMKEALIKSRNVVTVKVAEQVGIRRIIQYAKKFGIVSDIPADFSVALGSASASLLEMAFAYSSFAQGGLRPVNPVFIKKIEALDGSVVYEPGEVERVKVLEPATAFIMNDILSQVVERGSGWRARRIPRMVAGKTGTTNGPKDGWFIGYLPNLVTVSWSGYDDFRNMISHATGASVATMPVVEYNLSVMRGMPLKSFPVTDTVGFFKVGVESREITNSINEDYTFEPYPIDIDGNPTKIYIK